MGLTFFQIIYLLIAKEFCVIGVTVDLVSSLI
jgi:hypothetical protein